MGRFYLNFSASLNSNLERLNPWLARGRAVIQLPEPLSRILGQIARIFYICAGLILKAVRIRTKARGHKKPDPFSYLAIIVY